MRVGRWLVLVCVLSSGCGDDDAPGHDAGAADAGGLDAAGDDNDAGSDSSGDHAEARAIVTSFVEEFDRRMRLTCPCIVETGGYESVDVCLQMLGSGPDWVGCLTDAAAAQDSPALRATAQCFVDQARARNDCYENTECSSDERVACDAIQVECAVFDPQLIVLVSEKCPDTTILGTRL